MSEDVKACAVGCTVDWDGEIYPRLADVGNLCGACAARIRSRLDEAPRILAVLRTEVAGIRAVDTTAQRVSGTREAPLPFDAGVLELADELFSGISNWAVSHAATMGVAGGLPAWLGRLAKAEADASGLPAVSSPQEAAQRLREVVEWLQEWGDAIAHTIRAESLADYHEHVIDLVRRARGRAGLSVPRGKPRRRPCGTCGELQVVASVPDVGPEIVRCLSCHAVVDGSGIEWERAA